MFIYETGRDEIFIIQFILNNRQCFRVRESLLDRPGEAQVVPITVRQLEALIRISESLAKMRLAPECSVADVEEALRLFKVLHFLLFYLFYRFIFMRD